MWHSRGLAIALTSVLPLFLSKPEIGSFFYTLFHKGKESVHHQEREMVLASPHYIFLL